MPSAEPGPEGMLLQRMQREEIARAMPRLAPVHRETLLLALVQELSYPETVAALGMPLGTVKSRLSNACRALRALLGESAEGGA